LSVQSTLTGAFIACFGVPDQYLWFLIAEAIIEFCFFIDIVLNFFLEYKDDEDFKPVRDLKKIAIRYIKGVFIFDVLATLPLAFLIPKEYEEARQLVYLLKLLRLPKL